MSEKQDALAVATSQLPAKTEQANKLTRLAVFTPTNMTEAMGLAKLLANSDFVPKDFKGKAGNCFLAMQMGAELGVPPLQALQNIAIINGRPSIWGDLALAVVQAHPDYEDHKEFFTGTPYNDDYTAVFQIKRKGQAWHETKFSVADAKTAKLWGKRGYSGQDTPWITNPKRMLQMRSRGFGLRDKFADALKGMKLAEEIMDIPPDTRPETGTLDVKNEMATLTTSSEGNRGHGNEGMAQQPALSQPPGMDQTSKAQEETICGDCHEKNGKHKADCFYANSPKLDKGKCPECGATDSHSPKCSQHAAWIASKQPPAADTPVQEAKPETQAAQTTPQTVEPPQKPANERMVLLVKTIQERKKTGKDGKVQTYLVLSVIDNKNIEFDMYVWNKDLHPKAATLGSKTCLLEFSQKKGANNRMYCSLEAILEVAGEQAEVETEEPF